MKILVKGYSGSGKSTFARVLGDYYQIPVLHLDAVHFKENWQEIADELFEKKVQDFMVKNDSWIIDGNYSRIATNRNTEADIVFFFDFNRFFCLKSVLKRYRQNKGKTRFSMASGCEEKIDKEFINWVLFKGRSKSVKKRYKDLLSNCKKAIVFKNRKQVHRYYKFNNIPFDEKNIK